MYLIYCEGNWLAYLGYRTSHHSIVQIEWEAHQFEQLLVVTSCIKICQPATFTTEETPGASTSPPAADLIRDKLLESAAVCLSVSAFPKPVLKVQVSQTSENTLKTAVHHIVHSCMSGDVLQLPSIVHIGGMFKPHV